MMAARVTVFNGRSYPMMTITPIAPHRKLRAILTIWLFRVLSDIEVPPWLRRLLERVWIDPSLMGLRNLQFIHFARWTLASPGDFRESLRDSYLIFSTNFNGDWHQYLDSFAFTLPKGLDAIWGTSRSYPGSQPVTPFKEYAQRHMLPASYYYNAYPGASVRDIEAALEVNAALEEFRAQRFTTPLEFRIAFTAFVGALQDKLGACETELPISPTQPTPEEAVDPRRVLHAPLESAFRWQR
jgi:hypothetical protein